MWIFYLLCFSLMSQNQTVSLYKSHLPDMKALFASQGNLSWFFESKRMSHAVGKGMQSGIPAHLLTDLRARSRKSTLLVPHPAHQHLHRYPPFTALFKHAAKIHMQHFLDILWLQLFHTTHLQKSERNLNISQRLIFVFSLKLRSYCHYLAVSYDTGSPFEL